LSVPEIDCWAWGVRISATNGPEEPPPPPPDTRTPYVAAHDPRPLHPATSSGGRTRRTWVFRANEGVPEFAIRPVRASISTARHQLSYISGASEGFSGRTSST